MPMLGSGVHVCSAYCTARTHCAVLFSLPTMDAAMLLAIYQRPFYDVHLRVWVVLRRVEPARELPDMLEWCRINDRTPPAHATRLEMKWLSFWEVVDAPTDGGL